MRHLLIHPPFADPTQPYVALPAIKGHLRARRLDARVVDLNVEATHHLLGDRFLDDLERRLAREQRGTSRPRSGEPGRQRQALVQAQRRVAELRAAEPRPLDVLRDPELFYDRAAYQTARRRIEGLFEAVNGLLHPLHVDFNRADLAGQPWSLGELARYSDDRGSPLHEFYEQYFTDTGTGRGDDGAAALGVPLDELDFIGISIVFPSQIPEAFYLCRFLRQRAPHAFLALGGPCLHQAVVHMDEFRRLRVLEWVDGVGLYEGEATLEHLLPLVAEWRRAPGSAALAKLLSEVPNLLVRDEASGRPVLGPAKMTDLKTSAAPDYTDLDLDRYLAPSRLLLYVPTRGCYWDKCSFCYYGLSETATARYREVPPELAASQLAQLSRRHGTRHFYLSCDVLSPAYAVRFAQAVIDRGLRIRWSSDLKIERYFTPERCELLYRAGLRSAAFGIESGSDRILDLMRKGCDRATMTEVNRSFHAAGVATEWMTFTDHPGESVDEALATVDWIEVERDQVDLFIVGSFGLQPGSDIAQHPDRYGVSMIDFDERDDFRLYLRYEERGPKRSEAGRVRVDQAIRRASSSYELAAYPWAGANSTHHSFLYFIHSGQSSFRRRLAAKS